MIKFLHKYYARIFGSRFFFPIHRVLYGFVIRGMGMMNYSDHVTSGEIALLKRLSRLQTIETVVDIGANDGEYAKLLLKHLVPTKIFCIEAHPQTFARLKQLEASSRGLVHALHYAITDGTAESVNLFDHDAKGSTKASIIPNTSETFYNKKSEGIAVPAIRLEKLADKYNIEKIDFLKLDIEGAEYSALLGARKLLEAGSISYIQFEFNEINALSRVYMKDFIDLLADYDLYRLLPRGLMPIVDYSPRMHEIFAFQNVVAVHRNSRI